MSEELEDYEVQLNEIIEEIVNSLTKEVAKLSGRLKVEKCEQLKLRVACGRTVLKSIGIELRAIKKLDNKEEWDQKIRTYEGQLETATQDISWAVTSAERDDLFGRKKPVEEMTAKEITSAAKGVQMESIASTARAKDILQETIQIGNETATELKQQTEQIERVNAGMDQLETNLRRADKQLRVFFCRMASDKIVVAMVLFTALGVVAAIVVAIVKK